VLFKRVITGGQNRECRGSRTSGLQCISLFITSVSFLLQVGINAEDSRHGTFGKAPNTSENFEGTDSIFQRYTNVHEYFNVERNNVEWSIFHIRINQNILKVYLNIPSLLFTLKFKTGNASLLSVSHSVVTKYPTEMQY